jgi:hypothetical protein
MKEKIAQQILNMSSTRSLPVYFALCILLYLFTNGPAYDNVSAALYP